MTMKKSLQTLSLAIFALTLTACGKINKENYDKLSVGMEYNQVVEIIGNPDNCDTTVGVKSCIWGDDKQYIKVSFAFDKATIFTNKGLK